MIEPTSAGIILRAPKREAWAELADRIGLMLSRGFAVHVLRVVDGDASVMMTAP